MIEIIPTVVPKDLAELAAAMHTVSSFSRTIHVDIDDGLFVSSMTWPYVGVDMYDKTMLSVSRPVVLEAHLMVQHPQEIGLDLIRSGVHTLVAHIETCADAADAKRLLDVWRSAGAKTVGLAILLDTPLEHLNSVIAYCDVVQVMSVARIGAQGAPFDVRAVERVRTLHAAFSDKCIVVDGGVSVDNIASLAAAGAERFCVGSAIMRAVDPKAAYAAIVAAGTQ